MPPMKDDEHQQLKVGSRTTLDEPISETLVRLWK